MLADREDRGDHCGVCTYRHYCGGCRARALAYTGDIQAGDPGCIYNDHQWQELVAAAEWEVGGEKDAQLASRSLESELVHIAAINAVPAGARAGEFAGLSASEVRQIRELAEEYLKPTFTSSN